jgi:N-formylglutamate deformylase
MQDWLTVRRGDAPLIVAVPHAGTWLSEEVASQFRDPTFAVQDADYHVDRLYAFAADMGATVIATAVSRAAIDVNRDPSGASLYPGMATTALCPTTNFDGEPLYPSGCEPGQAEIDRRRALWFDPYHAAIEAEIARLRGGHPAVVLYDAHSIRSHVPRLFDGALPVFNIGTNHGATCDPRLEQRVEAICAASGSSHVVNGRFKGGWTTRHYGRPREGVHAIQMELAMRAYLREAAAWPPTWDDGRAAACQSILRPILAACIAFAKEAA